MIDLKRLAPIDVATLLYVGVTTTAALLFAGGDRIWLLTAHAMIVTVVLLAPTARADGPVGGFVGDWYPILMVTALYAEVGVLNLDFGHHHDFVIQRFEQWVFGSQVSYRWIRAMPNPAFSWILHACYLSYFAILVAAPFGLWLSGRRDFARLTIFAIMATLYLCYSGSIFFPVTGPRYAFPLAHNAATRVLTARATQWLLDRGDSWGTAFPSSHVAASIVATLCALRFWRPLGLILTPLTIGLTFAVVYGQFHYGVDAITGIVVAIAIWMSLNGRLWRDRATAPRPTPDLRSSPLRL
jgi:hypothetical protein